MNSDSAGRVVGVPETVMQSPSVRNEEVTEYAAQHTSAAISEQQSQVFVAHVKQRTFNYDQSSSIHCEISSFMCGLYGSCDR